MKFSNFLLIFSLSISSCSMSNNSRNSAKPLESGPKYEIIYRDLVKCTSADQLPSEDYSYYMTLTLTSLGNYLDLSIYEKRIIPYAPGERFSQFNRYVGLDFNHRFDSQNISFSKKTSNDVSRTEILLENSVSNHHYYPDYDPVKVRKINRITIDNFRDGRYLIQEWESDSVLLTKVEKDNCVFNL